MTFIQSILRGIGQVMFQNNMYSGLLFLVGIFINSWLLGLAALLGTSISTVTAHVLGYSKGDIQNGLYGFNGTLTGIAILCFFELNSITGLALILGAILSTVLMYFLKKILPPFTAPFVLATWIVLYSLMFVFNLTLLSSSTPLNTNFNILYASVHGFGQVMFQEHVITGLFFVLAIFVNNRLMAIYAIYASILGALTGWVLDEPISKINAGLMGYNAILCAIALVGKNWKDFLWITIAIILSTLINIRLGVTELITLTAPFVLATWSVLIVKNAFNKPKR